MINCNECGEPLIDEIDVRTLTVEGEEIPFRRTSDYLVCSNCGAIRSITSLRAEAVAKGELLVDDDEGLPQTPLQQAADEALAAILAMTDESSPEDADTVFTALADISREDDGEPSGA